MQHNNSECVHFSLLRHSRPRITLVQISTARSEATRSDNFGKMATMQEGRVTAQSLLTFKVPGIKDREYLILSVCMDSSCLCLSRESRAAIVFHSHWEMFTSFHWGRVAVTSLEERKLTRLKINEGYSINPLFHTEIATVIVCSNIFLLTTFSCLILCTLSDKKPGAHNSLVSVADDAFAERRTVNWERRKRCFSRMLL